MGCDIHLAVEVKRGKKWHQVMPTEREQQDTFWREAAERQVAAGLKGESAYAVNYAQREWYHARNYGVFAMLANVRNGSSPFLAGSYRQPVSEPKGLPLDLSDDLRCPANRWAFKDLHLPYADIPEPSEDGDSPDDGFWLGEHSFSWLTLAELQAYDWDKGVLSCGYITLEQWVARKLAGDRKVPYPHSGGIWGRRIVTVEEEAIDGNQEKIAVMLADTEHEYYVHAWWKQPNAEDAHDFYSRLMPELAKLDPSPENVRIVFGFDS